MTDAPLDPEQVAEIRERCEAATEGPWRSECWVEMKGLSGREIHGVTERGGIDRDEKMDRRTAVATWDAGTYRDQAESNAAFIAHARQDVPALCATVEHLRERLERYEEVVEAAREQDEALRLAIEGSEEAGNEVPSLVHVVASEGRVRRALQAIEEAEGAE